MQESGNTAWVGLLIFVVLFWDGMLLLLFGEVAFVGFGWLLLIIGGYAHTSHTPVPSREGRFGCCFFIGNEWFVVCRFPLLRGD